ncbi:MAG: efflux RND transporter periplasmic adaptor subunit [Phycisphaerae bacterium]
MKRKIGYTFGASFIILTVTAVIVFDMVSSESNHQARAADEDPAGKGTEPAVAVEVTQPERRTLTRELRMPATLLAGEMADLYAKTSGYISTVNVDIGNRVEKGQALLLIDVPEMEDDLRQSQAVLAARRAKAAQSEAMIEIARAEVQRAEAEHQLSHINHERKLALRKGKAIPEQELDDAKSRLAISDAALKIAKAHVLSAEADLKVAQSETVVGEANLARLKTLMGYATIKAPFAGTITDRLVDPGAFVRSAAEGTTTSLLSISRVDFIRLALEIPESDAPFVRIGTKVDINVKALGGEPIHAAITRTAGALKPGTRTMRAEVDLKNEDGRLTPGMYAQVVVKLETRQQALMLPSKAVRVRGRNTSVLVANGNTVESRSIEIGYDDGISVEVTGGDLNDDELVIISANSTVAPGAKVKPVRTGTPKT